MSPPFALTLTHHTEAVWQAIAPVLPGFTVEVLPSVDSTNSELMRRAKTGAMEPLLLAAEEQTAGRGRLGRHWHSQPGRSLTFSLALPMATTQWSGLSLVAGLSLAESLHPAVCLKWPNDLWLHQRKLGGVLVETASTVVGNGLAHPPQPAPRLVVVGVGINIARPADVCTTAAPGLNSSHAVAPMPSTAPAGLSEVLVGITPGEALAQVAPNLVRDLLAFARKGFAAFEQRFAQRDALRGQWLRLSDGREGQARGVDGNGALQILTAQGMEQVISSEVSVRPC